MAVQTIATTVGTTATVIIPTEAYAMPGSVGTTVSNTGGTNTVYIGPAGVTASTGVAVPPNSNLNLPTLNSVLYGVTSTGTTTVVVGLFS